MRIYHAGKQGTPFQGEIIISREFFNPHTKDYIHIEAHETAQGDFNVAFWTPDGNDGGHGFDGPLRHVVKSMQDYVPPDGFLEMTIPEENFLTLSFGN